MKSNNEEKCDERQHPLFTVVTVTYNAEAVIGRTLESVKHQDCGLYEYLVVDGASADGTLQAVERAQVPSTRVYSEPDRGLYDAMNKAIELARGEYLIFLNAGDSFANEHVLSRLAQLAQSGADVLYGQTQLVDGAGRVLGSRHLVAPPVLTAHDFCHGMLVCHQAFVARRSIVGKYNLDYRFSADYDWCIRCLLASRANAYAGDEPIISFLTDGLSDKKRGKSLRERFSIMCHYYGTLPTVMRHLGFVPRFVAERLRRRKMAKQ